MSQTAQLLFAVAGIYGCFLTWGLLQERVSTTLYSAHGGSAWSYGSNGGASTSGGSTTTTATTTTDYPDRRFTYYVFLNTVQSLCACVVAFLYVRWVQRRPLLPSSSASVTAVVTGKVHGKSKSSHRKSSDTGTWPLLWQFAKVALLSSIASPFGYGECGVVVKVAVVVVVGDVQGGGVTNGWRLSSHTISLSSTLNLPPDDT